MTVQHQNEPEPGPSNAVDESNLRIITSNPTRSGRRRWHPRHFLDFVPSVPAYLPHIPHQRTETPTPSPPANAYTGSPFHNSPSPEPAPAQKIYVTAPNEFGIFRVYRGRAPIHDPEQQFVFDSVCESSTFDIHQLEQRPWWSGMGTNTTAEPKNPFAPFLNVSSYRMVDWHYSSSETKSIADLDHLAKDVIGAPDFNPADVQNFNAATELKRMDDYLDEPGFSEVDGWKERSVKLRLPADGVRNTSEDHAPTFEVSGIWVRDLTQLVISACKDRTALDFHIIPFELKYKASGDAEPEDVISELYNSQAVNSDYQEVLRKSAGLGCNLEPGILALQFWSDTTTLANFGTAALWPIYLYFANLSKYIRGKPTSFAGQHLAYIPSVSGYNRSTMIYLRHIPN
jgi:Plavaka transposase